MSKEVGAGGRFEIFLDSVINISLSHTTHSASTTPWPIPSFLSAKVQGHREGLLFQGDVAGTNEDFYKRDWRLLRKGLECSWHLIITAKKLQTIFKYRKELYKLEW